MAHAKKCICFSSHVHMLLQDPIKEAVQHQEVSGNDHPQTGHLPRSGQISGADQESLAQPIANQRSDDHHPALSGRLTLSCVLGFWTASEIATIHPLSKLCFQLLLVIMAGDFLQTKISDSEAQIIISSQVLNMTGNFLPCSRTNSAQQCGGCGLSLSRGVMGCSISASTAAASQSGSRWNVDIADTDLGRRGCSPRTDATAVSAA